MLIKILPIIVLLIDSIIAIRHYKYKEYYSSIPRAGVYYLNKDMLPSILFLLLGIFNCISDNKVIKKKLPKFLMPLIFMYIMLGFMYILYDKPLCILIIIALLFQIYVLWYADDNKRYYASMVVINIMYAIYNAKAGLSCILLVDNFLLIIYNIYAYSFYLKKQNKVQPNQ